MGKVEKVYCIKDTHDGYDNYYFLYGYGLCPPEGEIIGFMINCDGITSLDIEDDTEIVPQLIEMMYDCLYDKKSFKIKF